MFTRIDKQVQENLKFSTGSHFSRVADVYRSIRTTDLEPILFVKEKMRMREYDSLLGADIGCGAGRYDQLLLDQLSFSLLLCLDANLDMAKQTRWFLRKTRAGKFSVSISEAEHFPIRDSSLDCISTFNAVHHFELNAFLREASSALKDSGRLFIYTRLPEQNADSIWGRYFPGFPEKETRLYSLERLAREIECQSDLDLEEVRYFRFHRVSSLQKLLSQVRERHYSTFSFYTPNELKEALKEFKANILYAFPDPDLLEWTDGNIMIVLRKK